MWRPAEPAAFPLVRRPDLPTRYPVRPPGVPRVLRHELLQYHYSRRNQGDAGRTCERHGPLPWCADATQEARFALPDAQHRTIWSPVCRRSVG